MPTATQTGQARIVPVGVGIASASSNALTTSWTSWTLVTDTSAFSRPAQGGLVLQIDALTPAVYLKSQVIAYDSSGNLVNPTADQVQMSFSLLPPNPSGQPISPYTDPATWYAASWQTVNVGEVNSYFARCLIGTDTAVNLAQGVTLPATYYVRVQIFDNPETVVLRCGPFALV